jgi:hypothetical protein
MEIRFSPYKLDFTDPASTPANVHATSSPQCGFLVTRPRSSRWTDLVQVARSLASLASARAEPGGPPVLLSQRPTLTHRASPAG